MASDPSGPTAAAAAAAADRTAARVAQLEQEARALRAELASAHLIRDTLGTMFHGLFRSWTWRVGWPVRAAARMVGAARLGMDRLLPLTAATRTPGGAWEGTGPGIFLVPTFPLQGWARVRATIRTSVATQCCLYFDTGRGFHRGERLPLATVVGRTEVDRLVPIRRTAYGVRFDPVEHHGTFAVESFTLEPVSRVTANLTATAANVRKAVLGPPKVDGEDRGHRPSVLIGLRLLLTGQWGVFHRQLVTNTDAAADVAMTDYAGWVKYHAVTADARVKMAAEVERWASPPTFSVLVPVYDVAEVYLRACLDSVLRQVYPHWELCVADDASPSPHVRAVLDEYAAKDRRVKVARRKVNGNIAAASNTALELATGHHLALLDHDDELAEHALYRMAQAIVADPSLQMLYSDEDKLSPKGERSDPFFKPDWSPEYFLACMYTCHLGVYRADLVRAVGGFRSEYDGAQDYDLVLRLLEANPALKIGHVPDVLYHWRAIATSTAATAAAKPEAHGRAQRAIQRYVTEGLGRAATVVDGPSVGFHTVRYDLIARPRVSLVIPSACQPIEVDGKRTWMALRCARSVRRLTTYADVEVLVLDRHEMPPELEAELAELSVRRVTYDFDFNWSAVNNHGAAAATGDVLVFMNDDTEVVAGDWVERMLGHAQWPDVGAVGPRLLFPDGTLQHAGVVLPGGNPTHPFYGFPAGHPGYFFSTLVHRNWVAVTGACMMVRADTFKAAGGFDPQFPLNYNDVEFCLRLHDRGLRVVYEPAAVLRHYESKTRQSIIRPEELAALHRGWNDRFRVDPYYNPNLTTDASDFRVNAVAAPTGDSLWMSPTAAGPPPAAAAPGEPYTFDRDRWLATRRALSGRYLAGDGVEVGALHQPLWTPPQARVRYVDRYDVDGLREHYPELRAFDLVKVDVLDDGERLDRFADDSLDFVICNHMLEHCENPLGTIRSHLRRVRPGGVLYYAVPDKRRTFDLDRDLTPFAHLVDDDRHGPARSRRQHYREWSRFVSHAADADVDADAERLDRMNYSIHFHVWDDAAFRQFVESARLYLGDPFAVETAVQNEFETITVLRKRSTAR